MTDPSQYAWDGNKVRVNIAEDFEVNDFGPPTGYCARCKSMITAQRRKFRFTGYSHINAETTSELTSHQYFLCDRRVEAFVFGLREWSRAQPAKFRPLAGS